MSHQMKRLDTATSRTNLLEQLRGRKPVMECSARVGCKMGIWYRWERGDSFPSLPYISRIEDLLTEVNGRAVSYREIWPGLGTAIEGLE